MTDINSLLTRRQNQHELPLHRTRFIVVDQFGGCPADTLFVKFRKFPSNKDFAFGKEFGEIS